MKTDRMDVSEKNNENNENKLDEGW